MTEGALAELMRSPLDDERPPRTPSWMLWLTAGCLAGLAAGIALLPIVAADEAPIEIVTTTTISTRAATGPVAIGGGLSVEPMWAVRHDDAVWIAFSTPIVPGLRSGDVQAIPTIDWLLTTGPGRDVTAIDVVVDPTFPGLMAVEFPLGSDESLNDATVTARPAATAESVSTSVDLPAPDLPWGGPVPPINVGSATVITDFADLRDDGGWLQWQVDAPQGVQVSVLATFEYIVAADGERRTLIPEGLLPGSFLQLGAPAPPPAASGVIDLFRTDDPDDPSFRSRWWGDDQPVDVERLSVTWSLVEFRPTGIEVLIPLDGVLVLRDGA